MPGTDISEALGEWEGYEVTGATRRQDEAVEIELTPIDGRPGVCSGCQQEVAAVHDYEPRRVRDLPILGAFTTLLLARRRLACPQCGPKLEHLSWLAPYAHHCGPDISRVTGGFRTRQHDALGARSTPSPDRRHRAPGAGADHAAYVNGR